MLCRIYVKQCKNVHVGLCQGHSGDYDKLRALVRECDLSVVEDMPMEDGWRLEENFKTVMNKSIPKSNRNEGPHNKCNRPMWMNDTALVNVKSKNEAYKVLAEHDGREGL